MKKKPGLKQKQHISATIFIACIALAACTIFLTTPPAGIQRALAFDIPAPDGYVTDLADVFTDEQEAGLEMRIGQIEKNTTAEIGVLTVKTTGGEDISQVAFDTGNKWGVGKKENDNGLMIVVAVDDRDWFMATGYGLEGAIPDAIAKRIGERDFPIYFKTGDYASGILMALNDIELYIRKDPAVTASYNYEPEPEPEADPGSLESIKGELIFMFLLFFSVFKSVFLIFTKRKYLYMALTDVAVVIAGFIFTTPLFAMILIPICLLFDFIAIIAAKDAGRGGGYSGGSSSDSSWSSGSSSWGSSDSGGSSGSSGGSFGGGSFGGGGAGGKW